MTDTRHFVRSGLDTLLKAPESAADILVRDAVWDMMAPVEQVAGRDAIVSEVIAPLRAAFVGLHRRDEIVIGGKNRREVGGRWVACVTHYVGTHRGPLWGVAPSGRLAFLRAGEFHRTAADGRITESRIILDLPDLMRQAGRMPFAEGLGTEMLFPGPATHDGVCPDPRGGEASLDLIERMLAGLHSYDPGTVSSPGQTGEGGAWADDMLWYGPGGIGSNYRWEGFVSDHRAAFLTAFPDRKGGNHYCRIGDGNYAAISGWPSMTMTHQGPYLGVPATGKALTLRVMDFYRCANGRIAENWVLLDYVDLFRQMGRNILS
ncbi:ester cyclase [Jannaschia seohaensis]|uniref:SnoaL-like polyketide cyclase n=1 Tax=Jannaschia seohaensis TaxID=475081 RepID=A0A2Y9AN96_9RHOB|nr:ester cyclase [Jannaschia seohaensis]PWJ19279.1 SnoaL-like polyketide cyclase [Jannaschia seohaensis]SSA45941.1 SnoaL-like polyketide cyclase [Jannaschia seohaensis]